MQFSNYISVFNNIPKNFNYLASEFIGFNFNADKITGIVINVFFAGLLMLAYFLIGKKIRILFFKKNNYKQFACFISLALGYIFVNSVLAIIGMFSLFYPEILWIYIAVILLISFYPYRILKNSICELYGNIHKIKIIIKKNKWVFVGTVLFVSIAFLRLIPPEIGEDAIGYHTSNPRQFLKNHTTIIPYSYVAVPAPHLGEMSYVLSEFMGVRDSARYIHFSFYFIVVFLLMIISPYAALFFVTAPVVIQISSKANVDFQWILLWLLSIIIISQAKINKTRSVMLSGLFFGGVLATKLWTIAFFPLFILYLLIIYRKLHLVHKVSIILTFSLSVFLVDAIWLLRSHIITGNPVYPAFSALGASNVIGFNRLMFDMQNISVFSPLFFAGLAIFLFRWRSSLRVLLKLKVFLFFAFLATEYLFIKYHFGRYLLGLYSLAVIVFSVNITSALKRYNLYKIILTVVFSILFTYYFVNTLLILPYGFGWADESKYLTRILSRDNSSYYDFDKKFASFISSKDKVATFEIFGYYYADFDYIDINNIFNGSNKSLDFLTKRGITKLFIKGGDIVWFCKRLNLYNCGSGSARLLAGYPEGIDKYSLYSIIKTD